MMTAKKKVWRITWTDKDGKRQQKDIYATADGTYYHHNQIRLAGGKNIKIGKGM